MSTHYFPSEQAVLQRFILFEELPTYLLYQNCSLFICFRSILVIIAGWSLFNYIIKSIKAQYSLYQLMDYI